MRITGPLLCLAFVLSSSFGAVAHEFWISPEKYQIVPTAPIVADIRVGQDFSGPSYSFLPRNITRFDIVSGGQPRAVQGRMGDKPALAQVAPEGLAVIVHETSDLRLTYSDWTLFERFATHKAFPQVLEQHQSRNLPKTGFSETYRRYAKSLVAVGHGRGQDAAQGLKIEIVALANPYTDGLDVVPVKALFNGKPRSGAQLEVFQRAPDGTVTNSAQILDSDGIGHVPVIAGHSYLLDTVMLYALPNDDPTAGPVWHSDWASLTFLVPSP